MSTDEPMRVLQVAPSMGHGGIEHFLMNLYRVIDKDKVQFDFMYRVPYECVFDKEIESLGGRIFRCVNPDRHPFSSARYYRSFFAGHPEVRAVHEHRSGCDGFFGVMREAKRAQVPVRVIHSHNSQKGWANNPIKDVTDSLNAPRLDSFSNRFIACSDFAADYLFGRCAAARQDCTVMPNAIDLNAFSFDAESRKAIRASIGIDSSSFVIGHIGRFVAEKNQRFLVEVLKRLIDRGEDAHLLLIGDGPLRSEVEGQARNLGVSDRTHFVGLQDNPAPYYSAADVFCMPSLFEGLPVSCIEAQASGLPMVLSSGITTMADVCGHTEFLKLKEGPGKWADALLKSRTDGRIDGYVALVQAGYDIAETAKWYESLYLGCERSDGK